MSLTMPVPHVVPPRETTMDDDVQGERRSGYDRRSPFADPKLWVSFSAVLLTVFLALFGYIATQLSQINAAVQAYALATTQNTTEIAQLRRDQDAMRQEKAMLEARVITLEKVQARQEAILALSKQSP